MEVQVYVTVYETRMRPQCAQPHFSGEPFFSNQDEDLKFEVKTENTMVRVVGILLHFRPGMQTNITIQ